MRVVLLQVPLSGEGMGASAGAYRREIALLEVKNPVRA